MSSLKTIIRFQCITAYIFVNFILLYLIFPLCIYFSKTTYELKIHEVKPDVRLVHPRVLHTTGYRLKMQSTADDDGNDNSDISSSSVRKLDSFQCLDAINL